MNQNIKNINEAASYKDGFLGLACSEKDSKVVILPVAWDVTASYKKGTANSFEHILKASCQVDLIDLDFPINWKNFSGIFMKQVDKNLSALNKEISKFSNSYIESLVNRKKSDKAVLSKINNACKKMNEWVEQNCINLIKQNKNVILLGGEHSVSLGYLKSLSKKYDSFGILHLDAHCDLRKSFENFDYSHASIMYNAIEQIPNITKLVQVGIRDFCEEEKKYFESNKKIKVFLDRDLQYKKIEGTKWATLANDIIKSLPQCVYISFDIDVLDQRYCPDTGTPVLGGLDIYEINYLLFLLHKSNKKIIGIDFVEIGYNKDNDWNANVASRILFKLATLFINY